jgi:hypothetical protein
MDEGKKERIVGRKEEWGWGRESEGKKDAGRIKERNGQTITQTNNLRGKKEGIRKNKKEGKKEWRKKNRKWKERQAERKKEKKERKK